MIGQTFGRWTVIDFAFKDSHSKKYFICKCECGESRAVYSCDLSSGKSISCGCYRAERLLEFNLSHGLSKSLDYKAWQTMIQRCTNKKVLAYKHYGAKGVTICDRWLRYENFLEDMGERPSRKHQLDRIDTFSGYSPSNCRWTSAKENSRNRRNNHLVTIDGLTMCMSAMAEHKNIPVSRANARYHLGWKEEDCFK
jgi:hypothetical protein